MVKGLKRIIVGIIIFGIGAFGWYEVLMESIPSPNSPPIEPIHTFDSLPVIIVHSIIAGIGAVILASGIKAYRSS